MGSKKEKQNPPPPKPVEESSEEEEEEEVEEDVEEEEQEEEEDEEVEEEENEPPIQQKPKPSSSSGTESDSDETDDDDHSTSHPAQHPVKRQATPPPETVPNSGSDDDETESGDDDEEVEEEADLASDSPRSATASAYTVKPITTVPVNSKVSKLTPKRALESSKNDGKGDRKKAKTGEENDKKGKGGGGFPGRVWSEESELVMLQGILDYQRDKGPIRSADTGVFYEFIKGKLWDGVTKTQIGDKIKRLKTKYSKNVKKGKNGQDPTFTKAHDKKAFELSNQIWGVGSSSVSNGKEEKAKTKVVDTGKGGKKVSNPVSETKRVVEDSSKAKGDDPKGKKVKGSSNDVNALMDLDVDVNGDAKRDLVKDDLKKGDVEGEFLSKFPTLSKSFDVETMSLKDYLYLIGSQNAGELEEEWKQLQLEEMNVAAKRVVLKGKQTKLVLDAMKKQ